MVVGNEPSEKPTHEDWEKVKTERDRLARRAIYALRGNKIELAKQFAEQWDELDERMSEISGELADP